MTADMNQRFFESNLRHLRGEISFDELLMLNARYLTHGVVFHGSEDPGPQLLMHAFEGYAELEDVTDD